jgi:hypothetical protein
MPDWKPTQEPPKFKGTDFPEFLLEKYLLAHPPPERPQILAWLRRHAKETLNFELHRAIRMYEEMSRDPTVNFSGRERHFFRPEA